MNTDGTIKSFESGQQVPPGYFPLTEDEWKILAGVPAEHRIQNLLTRYFKGYIKKLDFAYSDDLMTLRLKAAYRAGFMLRDEMAKRVYKYKEIPGAVLENKKAIQPDQDESRTP